MADLINTARAIQNAQLLKLNTANPTGLATLITAASVAIEGYCKRVFASSSYTEYYSGGNFPYDTLSLRQCPVLSISRLATNPQPALIVTNTSTANQRATVATTSTGLTLTRVASGVSTSSTLLFATYVTLNDLATAIAALANGWAGTVQQSFGLWPAADFKPLQGAVSALNGGAALELYSEEPQGSTIGYGTWDWTSGAVWRLDAGPGIVYGRFPRGSLNIRVDYTAGYATIPADVQEACTQMVVDLNNVGAQDWTVSATKIGPFSQTTANSQTLPAISRRVRELLSHYVLHDKLADQ